jgi:hypothetical protein
MRLFATDCLRWAAEVSNPSDREIIVSAAQMWLRTASFIEHRLREGDTLMCDDLRMKLD